MRSLRIARSLIAGCAVMLAAGCGNQSARVLQPDTRSQSSRAARVLDEPGPILRFFNASLDYTYPATGYCPCPETEVWVKVPANSSVTMNWSAEADPDRTILSFRWALDIEDVSDQTPRIDEATDLAHWSAPSAAATTATLGPWSADEEHRLYVEVEDSMGFKSLGIVRFVSRRMRSLTPGASIAAQQGIRGGNAHARDESIAP